MPNKRSTSPFAKKKRGTVRGSGPSFIFVETREGVKSVTVDELRSRRKDKSKK